MKYMFFFCLLCLSSMSLAFRVTGKITLMQDYLSENTKQTIVDLPVKLQDYFQSAPYSDEDIELDYHFVLSLKEKGGGSFTVEGQLLENNYKIQYFDKKIDLYYSANEILIYNEYQYHMMTSVFDFYFFIMIGDVMDNYAEMGGTLYFEKALRIARDGMLQSNYRGWDRRLEKVNWFLAEDNKPFRKAKIIIQHALSAAEKQDFELAKKNLKAAAKMIEECRNKNMDTDPIIGYFNWISTTLGDAFAGSEEPMIFQILLSVDPEHQQYYQQYIPEQQ